MVKSRASGVLNGVGLLSSAAGQFLKIFIDQSLAVMGVELPQGTIIIRPRAFGDLRGTVTVRRKTGQGEVL